MSAFIRSELADNALELLRILSVDNDLKSVDVIENLYLHSAQTLTDWDTERLCRMKRRILQ